MGITGLLPFLKKASRPASIKEFKGCTVAIDSYCWLHKGAFACAEKLAVGEKTDQYVFYCMKYINNLLFFGLKPVMVFDGCHLPLKKNVEKSRRERREIHRKKAAQLLREGKRSEARDSLTKCIDVTPQMALELMIACRDKGVDCIVAPYEADAQLAYLNRVGVAQVIITEDSDLILFGCERVMYKMDIAGNGMLIEQRHLNRALEMRADVYTFEKFRYMCILSGCDYLPSLPGIGLTKASRVFQRTRQSDIRTVIKKIPSILNMGGLTVTPDYIDSFVKADNTFLYQLVYNPMERRLVPLCPYPPHLDPATLHYAGPCIESTRAMQIAYGNIDVNTGEKIANFDPARHKPKSRSWDDDRLDKNGKLRLHMLSIWDAKYRPRPMYAPEADDKILTESTKGFDVTVDVRSFKRPVEDTDHSTSANNDLMTLYGHQDAAKRSRTDVSKIPSSLDTKTDMNCIFDEMARNTRTTETEEDSCKVDDSETTVEIPAQITHPASTSPTRNIFAVNGPVKKERFSLNSEKSHGTVEVKSRFFVQDQPYRKSLFYGHLSEGCENTRNPSPSTVTTAADVAGSTRHANAPSPSLTRGNFSSKLADFRQHRSLVNSERVTSQFKPVLPSAGSCVKRTSRADAGGVRSGTESDGSGSAPTSQDTSLFSIDTDDIIVDIANDTQLSPSQPSDRSVSPSQETQSSSDPSQTTTDWTSSFDRGTSSYFKRCPTESDSTTSTLQQYTAPSATKSNTVTRTPISAKGSKSGCRGSGLSRNKAATKQSPAETSSIKNFFTQFRMQKRSSMSLNHSAEDDPMSETPHVTITLS